MEINQEVEDFFYCLCATRLKCGQRQCSINSSFIYSLVSSDKLCKKKRVWGSLSDAHCSLEVVVLEQGLINIIAWDYF